MATSSSNSNTHPQPLPPDIHPSSPSEPGSDHELQLLNELLLSDLPKPSTSANSSIQRPPKYYSSKFSCPVAVHWYPKPTNSNSSSGYGESPAAAARREVLALLALRESANPALPLLLDTFDPASAFFVILEERPVDVPLAQFISMHGALALHGEGKAKGELLKALVTQLFGAVANMFLAGFAHLRLCAETTLWVTLADGGGMVTRGDGQEDGGGGQLILKGWEFAHEYGKEKTWIEEGEKGIGGGSGGAWKYAEVGDETKHGNDVWVAPECWSTKRYNARKAVIWSCGIAIYYMATGQTDRLSNLDHPIFEGQTRRSTISEEVGDQPNPPSTPTATPLSPGPAASETPTFADPATTTPPSTPGRNPATHSRRRSSLLSSRKLSISNSTPTLLIINYPGHFRLDTPAYARDIISKMLISNPFRRAELIEVAAKVPKESAIKKTRPLLEMAWLDYKTHVGPLAGLDMEIDVQDGSSSIFSGVSNLSNSFVGLLSGRRTSVGQDDGGRRRKSSLGRSWGRHA